MGNFQYYKYYIWHYGPSTLIKLWQCLMEGGGGPTKTLADSVYYKLNFKYTYHKNSFCKAIKFCQPK